MLIDTHAHITDPKLNAKEIIANMSKDNLSNIICVGYNYKNSLDALALSKTDDRLFCSVGLHPNYVDEFNQEHFDDFLNLAKTDKKVVAIGECGLDYHYEGYDKSKQQDIFIKQIELANTAKLPLIVHMRDADLDTQNILLANKNKLQNGGIMHCFSGSLESAKIYLSLGFYISFSGCITFKNAKKYPDIIKNLPLDKILIETDCPYLAPDPFRGQLNHPALIIHTAQKLATILDIPFEEIAKITTTNAKTLFKI